MTGQYNINGMDIWAQWGVALLRGSMQDLLAFLSPKPKMTHDWEDEDGEDVLYSPYRAQARDISVNCLMVANDSTDFWSKYYTFYEYLKEPFMLYVFEFKRAYKLRLVEYGKPQKWGSIRQGSRILMRFSMKLRESEPTLVIYNGIVDGAELTLPVTDSGEFLAIK